MTTKASGGRMTGLLAITCEAQEAMAVNDPVHIIGDYECEIADGTKPVVGMVSVANVGRSASTGFYPVAVAPGDVTVELFGFAVLSLPLAGTLAAGIKVGIDANKKLVAANGTNDVGVLLMGGDLDDVVDFIATGIAPGALV